MRPNLGHVGVDNAEGGFAGIGDGGVAVVWVVGAQVNLDPLGLLARDAG